MDEDYFVEDYKKNDKVIKQSTFNSLIIGIIIVTGIAAFFAGSFVSNLNSEQVSQKELENAIAELELKILEKQLPTNQPNIPLEISADDDPIIGNPDAPITIIEFSDFQCPFCARFHIQTLPTIMEEYIEKGDVKLVFRDFPLQSIHPNAVPASVSAECANEQGKFKEMHDILFEKQNEWSNLETSTSEIPRYLFTNFRNTGTRIPKKISFSPYSPFSVLKNLCECSAISLFASSIKSL